MPASAILARAMYSKQAMSVLLTLVCTNSMKQPNKPNIIQIYCCLCLVANASFPIRRNKKRRKISRNHRNIQIIWCFSYNVLTQWIIISHRKPKKAFRTFRFYTLSYLSLSLLCTLVNIGCWMPSDSHQTKNEDKKSKKKCSEIEDAFSWNLNLEKVDFSVSIFFLSLPSARRRNTIVCVIPNALLLHSLLLSLYIINMNIYS